MNRGFRIVEDRTGKKGCVMRGAALALWNSRAQELIIAGGAETGKTFSSLHKLTALLWKYPGARALMARKTYHSLIPSAVQTYLHKVLLPDSPVVPFGGERPSWFDYPNGSRLYVSGLDNPDKILSTEFDFAYINQCEELTLDDWEKVLTRTTGRAGNAPYAQLMGDCNPGPAHHWIKQRGTLKLLESRHQDNPVLYDEAGALTEQGRRTMAVLDALTGVRRDRLRDGKWVTAEGVVYEWFDARVHLLDAFPIPATWPRARVIDFGHTNPFACLFFAIDPDGRLYLYREIYMTKRTVRAHAEQINALSVGERYEATIADHDAEDRATLAECGIHTLPAMKAIQPGIQAVQERLQIAADGKPRLFVLRGCLVERDEDLAARRLPVCTEQEFDSYSWPKAADGRPVKEVPVDLHNHGMDCTRYLVMWANQRERAGGATIGASAKRSAFAPSSAGSPFGGGVGSFKKPVRW